MIKPLAQLATLLVVIGCARGVTLGSATWNGQPYVVTMTNVTGVSQTPTGSVNLPLQHDTACSISVSVAQAGNEILTLNGNSIPTSYMLTGAALVDADATWVTSSDFLTHVYHLPGAGPLDNLTLSVKATTPANVALPAGAYTASIILTVSW